MLQHHCVTADHMNIHGIEKKLQHLWVLDHFQSFHALLVGGNLLLSGAAHRETTDLLQGMLTPPLSLAPAQRPARNYIRKIHQLHPAMQDLGSTMFHPSKYSCLAHGTSGVSAGTTFSWASTSWGPGGVPSSRLRLATGIVGSGAHHSSQAFLGCTAEVNIQNVEKCLSHPLIDWSAHLITHLVVQPSCAHLLIHTHMMSFIYLFIRKCVKHIFMFEHFLVYSPKTTVYWFLLSSVLPHAESFAWLGGGSFSILLCIVCTDALAASVQRYVLQGWVPKLGGCRGGSWSCLFLMGGHLYAH